MSVTTMSQKPRVQTLSSFLYMLPVAMAWSSSDDSVIHYIPGLPVLCMTSHMQMARPGIGNENRAYAQNDSPDSSTRGEVGSL